MKNWNDNIKDKITQHEFDFSDQAWEKMDKLLDEPKEDKKTIIPFFNLKNTLIMLGLFLIVISAIFFTADGGRQTADGFDARHTTHDVQKNDVEVEYKSEDFQANTSDKQNTIVEQQKYNSSNQITIRIKKGNNNLNH